MFVDKFDLKVEEDAGDEEGDDDEEGPEFADSPGDSLGLELSFVRHCLAKFNFFVKRQGHLNNLME